MSETAPLWLCSIAKMFFKWIAALRKENPEMSFAVRLYEYCAGDCMKLSTLGKRNFLGFLIIFLFASYAGAQANRFQELLNAAKKEAGSGAFVVYASNPREEKTRQALFNAFKKKYGMPDFKFEWL